VNALLPEFREKPLRDAERAAAVAHIAAQHDDRGVALHFFSEGVVKRLSYRNFAHIFLRLI